MTTPRTGVPTTNSTTRVLWHKHAALLVASISLAVAVLAGCGSTATTSADATSTTTSDSPNDSAALDSVRIEPNESTSDVAEPLDPPKEISTGDEQRVDSASGDATSILVPSGMRSVWTGTIGNDIDVEIWLTQVGDVVRGEITYTSVGEPITLLGQRVSGQDWYVVREFADDGRVTGTMSFGSVDDGVVDDATWGDEDLTLTLRETVAADAAITPLAREAVYEAIFPPFFDGAEQCCGPMSQLTVSGVRNDTVTIEIRNTTSGPAFNLAFVDKTIVPLVDNRARYALDDDGLDCAFDVELYDSFARIIHVDDRFDCGFGNAAGVEGLYLLTTPLVATADSPFTDATLEFDSFGPVALGDTWESLTDRFGLRPHDPDLDGTLFGECTYVRFENDPASPWMMMLGEGASWVVSRIEVDDPAVRTAAGVGVGSTGADVQAAYIDQVDASPHPYLGTGAEYLRITSPKSDRDSTTIVFETDETGVVTSMRNGFVDPIQWIEGCA